ncbi:MAG: tRNA (adenosine(37)-N6)-threonylcarbamoyltransferase complex transferase subunit TsaD, partial [candidate division NC10 bacterium]|nr:tRNA (adenosine(37)-N6)-threonylcarbamoyltransferase complex transferase subunit TsaD [candidate division NC10 bacterium]
ETSCDETAASVLEEGRLIRSNVIASQVEVHAPYGGIVPELASRKQLEAICPVVQEAVAEAKTTFKDLDAVAVTAGPGLIGSLLVGVSVAKALSYTMKIPLVAVNHLEGHIYGALLEHPDLEPPFVALVVSGGHTHLYFVEAPLRYFLLGRTRDDAAGEAFDKVAKLLDLGYPGGPIIEKAAKDGNARIPFPRALSSDGSLDFSFSGLKTAVLNYVRGLGVRGEGLGENPLNPKPYTPNPALLADICASFQQAAIEVLVRNTLRAARQTGSRRIILVGGVACNGLLRRLLKEEAVEEGFEVFYPSPVLCTDNAAMIAAAGWERLFSGERASLDLNPSPDLPLA